MAQAFHDAISIIDAPVLGTSHDVAPGRTGLRLVPFPIGTFIGPPVIGRLFDTVGRKPMIVLTHGSAGSCSPPAAGCPGKAR